MTSSPSPTRRTGFRPDIQGMRAIAVISVLLFHAGVPGLEGGFVGVDVFYVLSGFLITGVLVRQAERSGGVDLLDFYARRLKRLAPVYLLVLALTLLAMVMALPPLYTAQFGPQLLGALFYVANVVLASDVRGYFAGVEPSPVLHFWSLAVEEQFYLVWPLAVLLVARRSPERARPRVGRVLLPVVLVSFLLAVVLTPRFPTPSFYLLHTRAWELGVGGLLACHPMLGRGLGQARRAALLVAGALAVLASTVALDSDTTFPGWASLPPVLGTAAMLVAGGHGSSAVSQVLLQNRAMVWLGDISYSLYLWHWPILVLPAAAVAAPLSLPQKLALVGLSVVAAWATHVWIERPFQQLPVQGRRRAIFLTALGTTLALAAASTGAIAWSGQRMEGRSGLDGIPALEQRLAAVPAAVRVRHANQSVTASGEVVAPQTLQPPLTGLTAELSAVQTNGCSGNPAAARSAQCWGGDPGATRVLVLLGDSHASQWWDAWDSIGRSEGYRVLALTANACPINDLGELPTDLTEGHRTRCRAFRAAALRAIQDLQPEVVVVGQTVTQYRVFSPDPDGFVARWREAMPRALDALPRRSMVLYLGDSPSFSPTYSSTPAPGPCLARRPAPECQVPHRIPDVAAVEEINRAAVEARGGRYVDLSSWLCTAGGCPMVTRNNVLYRDYTHVTSATSRIMTPILADELRLAR